ncbi:MAG: hypothetical protein C0608_08485 [Deltaproteobacteria bacterium]|nr:MAG: hypothetical protein C0608_08485 [Deltaproteobacteria bacterium]
MIDRNMKEPTTNPLTKIWDLFVSPSAFVILAILWCLDLGLGSILAYKRDPQFWMKMDSLPFSQWLERMAPAEWPGSLWVYILVALTWLMVASLLFCTVNWFFRRRKKIRGMGEFLVHLGFLLVFTGFVMGSGWGSRVQNISLFPGESTDIEELGLTLTLDELRVERDAAGNELDAVSEITLSELGGTKVDAGEAKLNSPLIYGSTVVYPNRSRPAPRDVIIDIEGKGVVKISAPDKKALEDGRTLEIINFLYPGQRMGKWNGPGVFLTLASVKGQSLFTSYLGFSNELRTAKFGDLKMTLMGVDTADQAIFNVHRDPGVQLVLYGALILTLGTFWALLGYLRRPSLLPAEVIEEDGED